MTCYKDTTFCRYWRKCADGSECCRALTDEVSKAAAKSENPVCQFISEPSCYIEEFEDADPRA